MSSLRLDDVAEGGVPCVDGGVCGRVLILQSDSSVFGMTQRNQVTGIIQC